MTRAQRPRTIEGRCVLTGYSGEERDAHLRILSFDRGERVRRAVAGLVMWWALALGCVFIPVAHFVLVPGFLLYGVPAFVGRLKTDPVVVEAHGTCPDCGAEQDLDLLGPWREDRDLSCRECHRSLRIEAR